MINTKLINSEATLNDFFDIDNVEYTPGENLTVAFRLFNEQKNIRYIPPAAATVSVMYTDTSGVDQTKAASNIDADDRGMWSVSFTQAETLTLASPSLKITVDVNGDATVLEISVLRNILSKVFLSGDC